MYNLLLLTFLACMECLVNIFKAHFLTTLQSSPSLITMILILLIIFLHKQPYSIMFFLLVYPVCSGCESQNLCFVIHKNKASLPFPYPHFFIAILPFTPLPKEAWAEYHSETSLAVLFQSSTATWPTHSSITFSFFLRSFIFI
jgi:hypothetical protein